MKKIFKYMFAVVAGVAALAACTNEPDENIKPEEQNGGLTIVASMGDATKTIMADGEGIKWEESDNFVAWYVDPAAEKPYSYALREEKTPTSITEDGYKAALTLENAPVGGYLWLSYGSNTAYDGTSAAKVEFNYNAAQTQATPGVANKEYMRLVGEKIAVEENGEYTAKMEVVGTIMRFIVYSSNGTYANENVKSVQLVSADKNIAGGSSAIAYNFADFYNTEAGRKWHTSVTNQFSDECEIFWDATSKTITTTLTNTFKPAADAASSKGNGVYMFVPPVKVGGYKYIVETNEARYIFDASTTPTEFTTNTIKNVTINLEKATKREDASVPKGTLRYAGVIDELNNYKFSYEGCADFNPGKWWFAETKDTDADNYDKREGGEYTAYYENVVFTYTDATTGNPVDWISVRYNDGGNSAWLFTVQPQEVGAPERRAVVTATFGDVNGYVIEDEYKTKSITVSQMAYTTVDILGFGGGVGDTTISGAGVDKQDLGWCAISVNGVYVEDWAGDSHNEQSLYGSVVIECREGAANGPIVEWLTVEYGKDAEGKHNSTHLFATAPANNTGVERKALVCCTYYAPEGCEFEGGAKSAFRQFFVTQPSDTGVKTISLWGGLAANYEHDANAHQDWGLSYWVVKVDGADATDWANDSRNEQAIYGGTQFKCYDYTNGVRGAEVDWVTVDYKRDAEGKVIDTWWLADIEANSGEARAAEIVCTFPALEGYAYEDGQNVRTTIIRQAGTTTGGGEEGGDEPDEPVVDEGMSYTIFNNAADGSKGTGFGPAAGSVGDWYRFENITINGKTYTPGDEMKNLASNTELVSQLIAKAFSFGEITEEDVQIPGTDPLTTNPESFVTLEAWSNGGAAIYVRIVLTANDSGARRTFKIITKDAEGNQVSSVVYFQNA